MENMLNTLSTLWETSGFYMMAADWRQLVMIVLSCLSVITRHLGRKLHLIMVHLK